LHLHPYMAAELGNRRSRSTSSSTGGRDCTQSR
jgi:hypothetical protein